MTLPVSVSSPTRILVVDDHPIVRQGLDRLVAAEPDLQVVAEAATADGALEAIDEGGVDFVILDIGLKQGSGLDVIGQIRARRADLPILVLSMHQERFYAERVLRSGAQGYVMKQGDPAEIVPAIRRILSGDLYLSAGLADELVRRAVEGPDASRPPSEELSDRETEVVRLIGDGLSTREVAYELNLSVKTVESYRANVKRKLGLRSGSELARFAYDWTSRSMGVTAG
ncbi:MAG: DNA-binding response regulator [Rhodothermaceae bacterium]|nr:DNA-binding response regulator [Rhodothermaceae bacterium]